MTKRAIYQSIKNAEQELDEIEDSPMLTGFNGRKLEIIHFIHYMKKELKHAK